MKLVITESKLNYILERLGVAEPTLPYVNLVYEILEDKIHKLLEEKPKNYVEEVKIGHDYIKDIYTNYFDEFEELPIESMSIDLYFKIVKEVESNNFATGGAAYQIEKKKKGGSYIKRKNILLPKKILKEIDDCVVVKMDIEIYITKKFDSSSTDELLYDLRDTILHEFNHIYEFYKRSQSDKSLVDTSLGLSGGKNYNVPKSIFNVWNDFIYFVYYSQPHEINAKTQEAYSKRLRMSFDDFKNTYYWKTAKGMEEFDSSVFYNKLVDTIKSHNPEYVESVLNRLYSWFMRDYKEVLNYFDNEPISLVKKSKNLESLIRNFEPKIKNAGKKLQRNYIRLYSLSPEENNL
jgi:hypothetical protein